MKTQQNHQGAVSSIRALYNQHMQDADPYRASQFQLIDNRNNNMYSDTDTTQGKTLSFEICNAKFYTLDSCPALRPCESRSPSAVSVLSNRSPFSQGSQSCSSSDPHRSPEACSGSPASGCSASSDGVMTKLREIEISLLGVESDIVDSCYCCYKAEAGTSQATSWWKTADMLRKLDLKQVLMACAHAISESESDLPKAAELMDMLGDMVSVSGDPVQRLGAYMLEGLRARLEKSGTAIYRSLKCNEPTGPELMTYMSVLYQICPYWKFAYASANAVIKEAVRSERRIHIIDFQITQGSQWMSFIEDVGRRGGGGGAPPPAVRVTGVDDSQSFYARGGGLEMVGRRLAGQAEACGVPFEFGNAAMCGSEVVAESLDVRPGEAVVVNFPYVLHHMPDESVSTENHRDRLLRLVKGLSPRVMTLVEQESNTNTSPFFQRFRETMEYYTAMFESIEAARPGDDRQRISAEQHCVARDIVNMVACEGAERVERHELFRKWRSRLVMAGFTQCHLSPSVTAAVNDVLRDFNRNYSTAEIDGALYLGWKDRAMSTASAWR